MILNWASQTYEKRNFLKSLAEIDATLPGELGRDDNNIFSLHEVVAVPDVDVVSFDFFDTLFFRTGLCLAQVCEKTAQLGATMVPAPRDESLSALYAARGYASWQLKREMKANGEGDEPPLSRVFARALKPLVADADRRAELGDALVKLEAGIELRNLEPNESVHAVFRNLKLLGRRVFVTSDMYLPGEALRRVLEHHDLMQYVDELLVSCDYGITKNSGDLFEIVKERAGTGSSRILHVGDNWENDVVQARARGLRAMHYYNYPREREMHRMNAHHGVAKPASVRREHVRDSFSLARPAPLRSLDDVIYQVIGPACALFMHDVLHRAIQRQTSDIYFLTRDGTIFKEIADAMIGALPELYPTQARRRILASSRATGMLLGFRRNDSDYLYINTEYLTEQRFSFERFVDLFDIPATGLDALPEVTRNRLAELGDAMDLGDFRNLYWEYPGFQDLVWNTIEAHRAPLVGYLEQEGLFDAHAPLLVDVGYSGTWGKQISPILEAREARGQSLPDIGFEFFATNRFFTNNVRQMHPSLTMRPGRILNHQDLGALLASLNYAWLEPFFLDPNLGKLEGFDVGNEIKPRFRAPRWSTGDKSRIEGLRHMLIGRCVQFAEDLLRHDGDIEEIRREVLDRLIRLIGYPRRGEALTMNLLSHERGMKTVDAQEISVRLSLKDLRSQMTYLMENDHWVQGSLARSHLGLLNHVVAWRHARTRPANIDWKP